MRTSTSREHEQAAGVNLAPRRTPWLAWFYCAGLLGLWLVFTVIGERWWPVAYLLYVPRVVWALPLLAVLPRLLALAYSAPGRAGQRRDWLQVLPVVAAAGVLLGPLGGLHWPAASQTPSARRAPGRAVRVLVQNVHRFPVTDPFVGEVNALEPDLVVLQEATGKPTTWWRQRLPGYVWIQAGEHLLGSRYPVLRVTDRWRSGHVRYDLDVDGQRLRLFSVHPPSPQFAVRRVLGRPNEDEPSHWGHATRFGVLRDDASRRENALATVAAELQDPMLSIVAGDTNIAGGGWLLPHHFARWTDAFDAVGSGFGYTFPAWAPWLRLDRLLVGPGLTVERLTYTNAVESDHRGLVADVWLTDVRGERPKAAR